MCACSNQLSPSISSSALRAELGAVSPLKGRASLLTSKRKILWMCMTPFVSSSRFHVVPCSSWVSSFVEGKLISCIKLSCGCCCCKWGRKFHDGGAFPWEGKHAATVLVWRWFVAQGRLRPAASFSHGIVSVGAIPRAIQFWGGIQISEVDSWKRIALPLLGKESTQLQCW